MYKTEELNKKILELLGWTNVQLSQFNPGKYVGIRSNDNCCLPDYATDLNACYKDLVPKFKEDIEISRINNHWHCVVGNYHNKWGCYKISVDGSTLAEVICKAFLKMEDENNG